MKGQEETSKGKGYRQICRVQVELMFYINGISYCKEMVVSVLIPRSVIVKAGEVSRVNELGCAVWLSKLCRAVR